jgi:hypothetical protein
LTPPVTISRQLNLVAPVDREDGSRLYVHAQPISYETFKAYWLVLSKTWAEINAQGLREISGPRVALLMLTEVAQRTPRGPGVTWWEGSDGVEAGLVRELVRLGNVLLPADGGGWEQLPLDIALKRQLLTDEEAGDVLGQLTFFTLTWRLADLTDRADMATGAARVHGSLTTSSDVTAYASSLRTSTVDETTGERTPPAAPPSLPPSSPTLQAKDGESGLAASESP